MMPRPKLSLHLPEKIKTWLHWLVLRSVPQIYLWIWSRRKWSEKQYAWVLATSRLPGRADSQQEEDSQRSWLYDELHKQPKLIPIGGMTPTNIIFYIAGHHDSVTEAMRNRDLEAFGVRDRSHRLPRVVAWAEEQVRPKDWNRHPLAPPGMNAVEGPDHKRLRDAVGHWFTPQQVARYTEEIKKITETLLDEIQDQPVVDLMSAFCRKLPAIMIGSVFGLSPEEVAECDYWRPFDAALTSLDVNLTWSAYRENFTSLTKLFDFVAEQVKHGPPDGLPQILVRDGGLTYEEVVLTSALMLEAGYVTTVDLLSNGVRLLLDNPDQLNILRRSPQLWPSAIEEVLRYEAPLRLNARVAARDTTLMGQTIKKDRIVVVNYAAANRDAAVFPDPHKFNVARGNVRQHLAFSTGRHSCIGPAFARTEALIALPAFFKRFNGASLPTRPVREDHQVVQRWAKLEVALRASNDIFDWQQLRLDV